MHSNLLQIKNNGASYINLSKSLGLVRISGQDATQLLQGQLTCDVREINPSTSRLGAYCNVKGRIQATFRLFMLESAYYLIVPDMMCASVVEDLNRYALFYQVHLEIVSEKWHITGLVGPSVETYLSSLSITLLKDGVSSQGDMLFLSIPESNRFLCLSSTPLVPTLPTHFTESSTAAWSLSDIQAGIPSVYPETKGMFTPHQLNYPKLGGVSFKKGCYTGQEIIARMEHLGQLKNKMVQVSFSCERAPVSDTLHKHLAPGTLIYDSHAQPQGTLVMAASIDPSSTAHIGLACIQNSSVNPLVLKNNPIHTVTCLH